MSSERAMRREYMGEKDVATVWEILGLSRDDYMMLYWDLPNKKVMAIDHVGHPSAVGDIYDNTTDDGQVVSFKIREAT